MRRCDPRVPRPEAGLPGPWRRRSVWRPQLRSGRRSMVQRTKPARPDFLPVRVNLSRRESGASAARRPPSVSTPPPSPRRPSRGACWGRALKRHRHISHSPTGKTKAKGLRLRPGNLPANGTQAERTRDLARLGGGWIANNTSNRSVLL